MCGPIFVHQQEPHPGEKKIEPPTAWHFDHNRDRQMVGVCIQKFLKIHSISHIFHVILLDKTNSTRAQCSVQLLFLWAVFPCVS